LRIQNLLALGAPFEDNNALFVSLEGRHGMTIRQEESEVFEPYQRKRQPHLWRNKKAWLDLFFTGVAQTNASDEKWGKGNQSASEAGL
jgi:hypothetical protein